MKNILQKKSELLPDLQGQWLKNNDEETIQNEGHIEDGYSAFSKKISRIKRLSDEEERDLGARVKKYSDKEAQKLLVLHNMRLALKMAHQYRRMWTNTMDLVQEASAGLAIAAKKWDPDQGTRFGTYAAYWIKAQLAKFLMTNSRLIHTANTRAGRKVYFSLPQIRRKLLLEGKTVTPELVAQEVGEDPREVGLILSRLEARETSLSSLVNSDSSSTTLGDLIKSEEKDPESLYAQNETQKLLSDIIGGFQKTLNDQRDLAIWNEHLMANDPVSLVELGKKYGVSKQRIGQLIVRIKRSFRRYLIDRLGPDTKLSWLFRDD